MEPDPGLMHSWPPSWSPGSYARCRIILIIGGGSGVPQAQVRGETPYRNNQSSVEACLAY